MREQSAVLNAAVQAGLPIVLWGISGTGKTSRMRQLEEALRRRLWSLSLAELEPTDLIGFPITEDSAAGKVVRFAPPAWAREVAENGGGIVFFDELNRVVSVQVLNAGQRIIHERRVGDLVLPERTSFVAACNPAGRSGTLPLTSAFANRCLHVEWQRSFAEWRQGVLQGWPVEEPRILPSSWRSLISAKSGIVAGFLASRPTLLDAEPDDPHEAGQAWPSGRTWEMGWTMLAALGALGYSDKSPESILAMRAAVGEGAAKEWRQFITHIDLPDPEAILADPVGAEIPERQDYLLVILSAVAQAALDKSKGPMERASRYKAAWKYMGRAAKIARDVVIPSARTLALGCPKEVGNSLPREVDEILTILERSGIQWGQHG